MTKFTHMIFWIWMQCWIFRWDLAFMVQRFPYNNLMNFVKSDLLVKSLLFIPPFWYIRLLNSGVFFTKWGKEIQQMSNRDILLVWQEKKLFDLEGMIKTTRAQWMSKTLKKLSFQKKKENVQKLSKYKSWKKQFKDGDHTHLFNSLLQIKNSVRSTRTLKRMEGLKLLNELLNFVD